MWQREKEEDSLRQNEYKQFHRSSLVRVLPPWFISLLRNFQQIKNCQLQLFLTAYNFKIHVSSFTTPPFIVFVSFSKYFVFRLAVRSIIYNFIIHNIYLFNCRQLLIERSILINTFWMKTTSFGSLLPSFRCV